MALDAPAGPLTETCVEHGRALSKCEASDSGTGGCVALLSLFPLRPLTHDPPFELRVAWLERVAREALCHAEILFGI